MGITIAIASNEVLKKTAVKAVFSVNALHEQNALSSHGLHRSTFGEEGLNYRVRNGIG